VPKQSVPLRQDWTTDAVFRETRGKIQASGPRCDRRRYGSRRAFAIATSATGLVAGSSSAGDSNGGEIWDHREGARPNRPEVALLFSLAGLPATRRASASDREEECEYPPSITGYAFVRPAANRGHDGGCLHGDDEAACEKSARRFGVALAWLRGLWESRRAGMASAARSRRGTSFRRAWPSSIPSTSSSFGPAVRRPGRAGRRSSPSRWRRTRFAHVVAARPRARSPPSRLTCPRARRGLFRRGSTVPLRRRARLASRHGAR